jgi:hypothetical protein
MPSSKEIDAFTKNAEQSRRLATFLASLVDTDWRVADLGLLNTLIDQVPPPSYRQAEWLLELRDRSALLATIDGMSIARMLRTCREHCIEFEPETEAWIRDLHDKKTTKLRRGAALRLRACLRHVVPDLADEAA